MAGRKNITFTVVEFERAVKAVRDRHGKVIQKYVADELGVSYPTYLKVRVELGLNVKTMELSDRDPDLDGINLTEEDFDEYIEKIEGRKKRTSYDLFEYLFNESIQIKPIGDVHLGSDTVLYQQLWEDIKYIKKTPNCKTILLGDYIDNFTKFSPGSAVYDQLIPPAEQKIKMEWLVKYLGHDKILGIVQGCHDEWSYRNDTFELGRYLAEKIHVPYLGFGGNLNLTVGANLYRLYVSHDDRYFSKANLTHGLKRAWREEESFNLGISAHRHRADYEEFVEKGRVVKVMKISGYKARDRFLKQKKKEKYLYVDQFVVLLAEKVSSIDKGIVYFTDRDHVSRFI